MNPLLAMGGVVASVLAQISLKYAAGFRPWTAPQLLWLGGGAALYGASFLAYSALLRSSELSRLSPLMAVAVAALAATAGALIFGEPFTLRKIAGLALAAASIFLLAR